MHDDLQAILTLWENDRAALLAEERLSALDAAIQAATTRLAELAADRAALEARRTALNTEDRDLQRRLSDVITRRQRTQALIDAGKATDFLVATRQVEAMAGQQDELETRALEIMEELETLAARETELQRSTTLAEARHREALADRDAQSPGHRDELARLAQAREPLWTRLLREDQNRYRNLRARGQIPVSRMVDSTCSACRRAVPPQTIQEIRRAIKVHCCLGCYRWLYET